MGPYEGFALEVPGRGGHDTSVHGEGVEDARKCTVQKMPFDARDDRPHPGEM